MELKVMTFNLRVLCKEDGINNFDNRIEKIKAVIDRESPDFIGFQEVTDYMRNRITEFLSAYSLFGCGRNSDYHGESMLMGYKNGGKELVSLENKWLSPTPDVAGSRYEEDQSACPRMFTAIIVKVDDITEPLLFINTHLDHVGEISRKKSAEQIQKYVEKNRKEGQAVILTGDFNATPDSAEIRLFSRKNSPIHDCTDSIGGTFHDFGRAEKIEKIDYIFSNLKPEKSYTVPDEHKDGIYYSDHFALCTIFEI